MNSLDLENNQQLSIKGNLFFSLKCDIFISQLLSCFSPLMLTSLTVLLIISIIYTRSCCAIPSFTFTQTSQIRKEPKIMLQDGFYEGISVGKHLFPIARNANMILVITFLSLVVLMQILSNNISAHNTNIFENYNDFIMR